MIMLRVDPDYFGAKIAQNKRKQDGSRPSFFITYLAVPNNPRRYFSFQMAISCLQSLQAG